MSDFEDETPVPLRDIAKHGDLGLDPRTADELEARARARFIRQAHVERRPLWRRRAAATSSRPVRRLSRRAGILGAGLLVAGGTAVAATTPWTPTLGGDDVGGRASPATSAIPRERSATLGVLRREQTDADRSAATESLLRILGPAEIGGVHTDGIRLLHRDQDGVAIIVPVQRADRRSDVLCVLLRQNAPAGGSGHAGIGQRCNTPAEIADGAAVGGAQYAGEIGVGGLVPDGVTRVEVPLRGGPTLTADVHDNYFLVNAEVSAGTFSRGSVRLLGADGSEVVAVEN